MTSVELGYHRGGGSGHMYKWTEQLGRKTEIRG